MKNVYMPLFIFMIMLNIFLVNQKVIKIYSIIG